MPETLSHPVAAAPVRFGVTQGYQFDGDRVRLDANLILDGASIGAAQEWALQLWACAEPYAGGAIDGALVAELSCGSFADVSGTAWVSDWTDAQLPTGGGSHAMVMAVVAGADGRFDAVHDVVNFARRERFCLPGFCGAIGFSLTGGSVDLSIAGITNPRATGKVSGMLVVELWAMAAAHRGGEPDGTAIASTALGTLAGGGSWTDLRLRLPLLAQPAGTWRLCAVLREWDGRWFRTRDSRNFDLPVTLPAPPAGAA